MTRSYIEAFSKTGRVLLSPRLHDALFFLFLAGILAYGAAFAAYMLASFDLVNLIRDVNIDDSFYYYEIASNLSEGKFSTFDGGITRTNGYHPIWMLLITPFYWVFDKETALFAIKAFEIMLVAGGVALVAVAARLARLPWVLLFAALPILYQHQRPALFWGMEAAAALFMLGLLFLAGLLYARNPMRCKWLLAAVAFALPWVRLEYVAISLAVTAMLCLVEWSRHRRASGASTIATIRAATPPLFRAFVPFLAACTGILTYFLYNGIVFGGIVPVSGATKQAWSSGIWEQEGGYSLARKFSNTLLQHHAFGSDEFLAMAAIFASLALVWWLARRSRDRSDWLALAFLLCVSGLAAGHLAKFAEIVLTKHPKLFQYVQWYFVPAYLMMVLVLPVVCYVAIHLVRRFVEPKTAGVLSVGIVVVGAVFLLPRTDFDGPFEFVDAYSDNIRHGWNIPSYMGVQIMDRLLPDDSVVGSWDAGVVGYFSRFPVVNLDGLVNSYDYLHATNAIKKGYADWRDKFKPIYLEFGINHFANMTGWELRDHLLYQGIYYRDSSPLSPVYEKPFSIWSVDPADDVDPAVRFWSRISPHFDYQSDSLGLIVDGRIAQALVRECEADVLVWSWARQGDGAVVSPWTQTQIGLCVAGVVLPRDALPPVRIESRPLDEHLAHRGVEGPPAIRSVFDVHLWENSLIYVKLECDLDARFFLHLFPVDADDLPDHRKQHGFDNLDFSLDTYGGACLAEVPLPEYEIAAVRTGQFVRTDNGDFRTIWEGEISLDE